MHRLACCRSFNAPLSTQNDPCILGCALGTGIFYSAISLLGLVLGIHGIVEHSDSIQHLSESKEDLVRFLSYVSVVLFCLGNLIPSIYLVIGALKKKYSYMRAWIVFNMFAWTIVFLLAGWQIRDVCMKPHFVQTHAEFVATFYVMCPVTVIQFIFITFVYIAYYTLQHEALEARQAETHDGMMPTEDMEMQPPSYHDIFKHDRQPSTANNEEEEPPTYEAARLATDGTVSPLFSANAELDFDWL